MTGTITPIRVSALQRGITRLCHFTPSRNLAHIANDPRGVLATRHLKADEQTLFNPTDIMRLDGYPDHVCCSIQYPNAWYFRKARQNETLFRDWVVLLIHRRYLWQAGTKFCPRNAAAAHGRLIGEGVEAFHELFADLVEGVHPYHRGPNHLDSLPTDEQAEVLVPDRIRRTDVQGVVVRDDAQAARETSRLKLQGLSVPRLLIVPEFFDPRSLSRLLRSGRIPRERQYRRGDADD